MYFNAHTHTDSSSASRGFKDAISTIEDVVNRAVELNLKGVAFTEHEFVGNHLNAITYVENGKKNGTIPGDFVLGLGNEIYLQNRTEVEEARANNEYIRFNHLILIAKDKIGHRCLRELSSKAWENSFMYRGVNRTPLYSDEFVETILKYRGHIICSTACLGSAFSKMVLEYIESNSLTDKQKIVDYLNFMYKLFGNDFYIELQPSKSPEQVLYNSKALEIANVLGIKAIISCDVHFVLSSDRLAHSIFLNSGDGDREVDLFYESCFLQSVEDIYGYMQDNVSKEDIDTMLLNTIELSNKIKPYTLAGDVFVPNAHIPEYTHLEIFKDYYDKFPYIEKFASSPHNIDRYFLHLIEEGFLTRGKSFIDDYLARIDIELKQVWEISEYLHIRLSNYYCLVLEIIEESWKTSIVGTGRGSSGCFEILYLCGITQISGYDYGLDYWRHICVERASAGMPDIDTDFQSSQKDNIIELLAKKYGRERVLSICTFKTNGAKETILSTFRGLGLSDDKAHYLNSLLGSDKGGSWSIKDSYYGNDKKERKPIKAFVNEVNKYSEHNLLEIMSKLEGIIVGRSSHAAATVLFSEEGYNENSAMMKTAKGQYTTQYEMRNTEAMGSIKMDLLVIEATDIMRVCLDMLLEDGLIEWKGSLKSTFDYYLHPDVLDMKNKDMIKLLYTAKNMNFFQMETIVGQQALAKVQPQSFEEVCAVNSLMRLSTDEEEQPLGKFVRFRDSNCEDWYKECYENGLVDSEIDILKRYLSQTYGICDTQEALMKITMDKDISGFDLIQSNTARKAIAKKSGEALEKFKKMFFEQGEELGARKVFLDYIWKYCFSPSFGYSFSLPHVVAYTLILWQELNLCHRFGTSYWKAACLTVNAGLTETDKKGTIDYGKIAEAVGNMKEDILPPCINTSKKGFSVNGNKILYGLVALNGVNEEEAETIIANRPYNSFNDFTERCKVSNKAIISLIKAGAFSTIESDNRTIAMEYIKNTTPLLKSLTTVQADSLVNNNMLPIELKPFIVFNTIRKQTLSKSNLVEAINKTNGFYKIDEEAVKMLRGLNFTFDFTYDENGNLIVEKTKFQNAFKKQTEPLTTFLKSEEALNTYNRFLLNREWSDKFSGDYSDWEMESIRSYIVSKHKLTTFDLSDLPIKNQLDIPEPKKINDFKYETHLIAGTCVNSDKDKHTLGILTENGVVRVKLSKQMFAKYNRVDSIQTPNGKTKKQIVEDTWFKAGTHLIIQGYKDGEVFFCKQYQSSIYPAFIKINGKNQNNKPVYKFGRD